MPEGSSLPRTSTLDVSGESFWLAASVAFGAFFSGVLSSGVLVSSLTRRVLLKFCDEASSGKGKQWFWPGGLRVADVPDFAELVALGDFGAEAIGLAEVDSLDGLVVLHHVGEELSGGGGAIRGEAFVVFRIAGFRGVADDECEITGRDFADEVDDLGAIFFGEFTGAGGEGQGCDDVCLEFCG